MSKIDILAGNISQTAKELHELRVFTKNTFPPAELALAEEAGPDAHLHAIANIHNVNLSKDHAAIEKSLTTAEVNLNRVVAELVNAKHISRKLVLWSE